MDFGHAAHRIVEAVRRLHRGPPSPASFRSWVVRGTTAEEGYPAAWPAGWGTEPGPRVRVAAVVHAFHLDLLDELIDNLAVIPVAFDLLVTNASGSPFVIDRTRIPRLRRLEVLDVENRGRDLWPLVQLVGAGFLDGYDLVVKVHTKRSDWRAAHAQLTGSGALWRSDLLAQLLGDRSNVEEILDAFVDQPHLGLVTADGSVMGRAYWGSNQGVTRELLRRIGLKVDPATLTFAAGSMYWIRARILRRLADLRMTAADFEDEQGQIDGTTAHALERAIGLLTIDAGLRIVQRSAIRETDRAKTGLTGRATEAVPAAMMPPRSDAASGAAAGTRLAPAPPGDPDAPAVVAFYLPQYHRVAENDAWWGEGFTDWRNVTAARPLYSGHAVPNLPGELGEYDLLSRDVRAAQAKLAREHGVYGFCYYFYWFGGRRLLERPIELMLEDGQPDLPFCLCWANEPWTRRWDGREQDVLMPQLHDRVRDLAILDDLMPYFEDPRYIRVEGRPLLLIYRQALLHDSVAFARDLRAEAERRGLRDLYLCNVMSIGDIEGRAPGFDAAVEFPPHTTLGLEVDPTELGASAGFKGRIYDYASVVQTVLARPVPALPCFPGAMPRWDNTARKRTHAHIFHGSTPELFERWLRRAAFITQRVNPQAPLLFVNSWNEWAEGAHLEPDVRFGRRYLEVVGRLVRGDEEVERGVGRAAVEPTGEEAPNGTSVERITLRPGWPEEVLGGTVSDGVASLESADGRPLLTHVLRARHDQPFRLRGWFYGDSRGGGRSGGTRYLVLSSGRSAWHAPIRRRLHRLDVLRGLFGRRRRSRKMVRIVDHRSTIVRSSVYRLWAMGRDRFGFDVSVDLEPLPFGKWDIRFVEVSRSGVNLVDTEFILGLDESS